MLLPASGVQAQDALKINEGESVGVANAGYFGLRWGEDAEEAGVWRLERDNMPSFESAVVVYEGPDHGTFESGLPDGIYYYRLIREGRTGPVYTVEVQHHSLSRAFLFLGIGAIVFLALLFVLIRALRRDRVSEEATIPTKEGS